MVKLQSSNTMYQIHTLSSRPSAASLGPRVNLSAPSPTPTSPTPTSPLRRGVPTTLHLAQSRETQNQDFGEQIFQTLLQ
ncbi:hypothetical protein EYF80_002402 [Liparis tanakae]|uniref:Uncharacterized protein n=1 Tax=Liparis tanakae TaxID=230148 RepID=A0A4Z2JAR2_9TELE|nr:hypothetical protein EYF80_002402 [Liparis tanakae]